MDADRRLSKALEAANDALQHLSITPDFGSLDCTHIDRLLARVVDLPTEGLGQLYWRLGELNSSQFDKFKASLQQRQPYLSLTQNANGTALVVQRIRYIQRSKADACQDFLCELSDLAGAKGKCLTAVCVQTNC